MQLEMAQEPPHRCQSIDAPIDPLVGNSPRMRIVHGLIAKLADNSSTVLITGESGTGKELAAHAIHELSARRKALCS